MNRLALLILATWAVGNHSFVVLPAATTNSRSFVFVTPPLAAKKKRRRKQDTPAAPSGGDGDELPEFDILDEDEEAAPEKSTAAAPSVSEFSLPDAAAEAISPSMMGGSLSGSTRAGSVSDLLKDRSLEGAMDFTEDGGDEDLPDFASYARGRGDGGGPAPIYESKAARKEARVAAAIARQEKEAEEEDNILKKIPGFGEDVTPIKFVENGTWLSIGVLIAWEVYINSPFFQRAAPMAPVVFDQLPN